MAAFIVRQQLCCAIDGNFNKNKAGFVQIILDSPGSSCLNNMHI